MKRVLSIDGGGIRGLVPALICKEIENISGKSIKDQFDLIAGTSTGGIIALGLADNMTAESLVKIYEENGGKIFARPKGPIRSLRSPKYGSDGLKEILEKKFDGRRLTDIDTKVKVLVTAYDLNNREPLSIKNWDLERASNKDYELWRAACATSAAPTFFEPTQFIDNRSAIDGGIYCNNPALIAYLEASKLWRNEEIWLLSLGTGTLSTSIPYDDAKRWGKLKWILPLIDCVFDGISKTTNSTLKDLSDNKQNNLHYFRMQFTLDNTSEKLDDASSTAMNNLRRQANTLLCENGDTITTFVELGNHPPVDKSTSKHGRLDAKSKYLTYHTSDIVLEDLKNHQMYLGDLKISHGFTITDLRMRCRALYHSNFSDVEIHERTFMARAHAFTEKYGTPFEDEKLMNPHDIQVPNLRSWDSYLKDIISELNLNIDNIHVLDVGAGHGQANLGLYRSITSLKLVDISEVALSKAKKSMPHAVTIVASAEELSGIADDSINVYFSFRTFQSTLFDVRAALHEAYRVLARNGVIIISIPVMFPKQDGTVSWGLLRQGEKAPSAEYANQVAEEIASTASCLGFRNVSIDNRSLFELYIIGHR